MGMIIGKLCPQVNFHFLNGLKKQVPQVPIKFIDLIHGIEVSAGHIIPIIFLERQKIRR